VRGPVAMARGPAAMARVPVTMVEGPRSSGGANGFAQ